MERSKKRLIVGAGTFATALSIGYIFQYDDALASRFGVEKPVAVPTTNAEIDERLTPVSESVAVPRSLGAPTFTPPSSSTVALNTVTDEVSIPSLTLPTISEPDEVADLELSAMDEATDLEESVSGLEPMIKEVPKTETTVAEIDPDMPLTPTDGRAVMLTVVAAETANASLIDTIPDVAGGSLAELASALVDAAKDVEMSEPAEAIVAQSACNVAVFAQAQDGAMVELNVDAPCQIEQAFTIQHKGVSIIGQTDDIGLAQIIVSALDQYATFDMTFEDGELVTASAEVPELADYACAVLYWEGAPGFELHAFHNGATFGAEGHVCRGTAAGNAAFFSADANGHALEVYTVPLSDADALTLKFEAEVRVDDCGQAI
ncbi:hypothetical protein [Cognatiyoonia sp.]|uniref:hypothetical protein n=1 Tax=Cognatiyoonia sp. TaxID=2211652 RepID=UPI003F69B545